MEPLRIKSKSNTKLKSIFWGTCFISLGLAFDTAMIALIITEGFSIIWVLGVLVSVIFFFAAFHSFIMIRYPLVLLADDKGIHYLDYDSKVGYGMQIVTWENVSAITQYVYDNLDPEDLVIDYEN